jgi:LacI family transcriptional regulator
MRLKDVADSARVSASTVSRVLNHPTSVGTATRDRVTVAIETLGYSPNFYASSLATGKSRTVGVIVSNSANPFFLDVYKAIERAALEVGHEVIMANTDYKSECLASSVRLMLGRRVAGLAVIAAEVDQKSIEELEASRIPLVFYDFGTPRKNTLILRVNYLQGMERLIRYLYSLGHSQVGFVGHHTMLGSMKECMRLVGEPVPGCPRLRVTTAITDDNLEGGRRAARTLLTADRSLTALMCATDLIAVGALRGLRESGLRVPNDISVTGFGDVTLAQFCFPTLTSVNIPRDRIGQTICDFLLTAGDQFPQEVFIDPELVVRDSTALLNRL